MKTPQAFSGKEARQMAQGRSHVAVLLALLAAWPAVLFAAPASAGELACGTARPTGCEAWVSLFSDGDTSGPRTVASADGTKVFAVALNLLPTESRVIVNAYDAATGALLWNTSYMPRDNPIPSALALSPNGQQLYVVGAAGREVNSRAWVLVYDTDDGAARWSYHWGPGSVVNAVSVSLDGSRIFVAGWIYFNYLTAAFDAGSGQKLWQSTYDNAGASPPGNLPPAYDVAYAVDASPDGTTVAVTGISADKDGTLGYATLAYEASTGAQRWLARHQALAQPLPRHTGGFDLAIAPDGARIYVMGTDGAQAYDAATGEPVWVVAPRGIFCRPTFSAYEGECDLEVSPDGERVFAGTHNNLAAYEAHTGRLLWAHPIALDDPNAKQTKSFGNGMRMSPDASTLFAISSGARDPVVTSSIGAINSNYETIAVDAGTGALLWRAVYDRGWEQVYGLALSPDGRRVFVAGESSITEPADLALVAYDVDLGIKNLPEFVN